MPDTVSESISTINSGLDNQSPGSEAGGWFTKLLAGRPALLEIAAIFLAVTFFCLGFLDLSQNTALPGNESSIFQMLDQILYNSVIKQGKFPLWNPYLDSGVPYIGDPMLHAYNPVVTIPVLLMGVRAGFKFAIYLSFLLAALGMHRLASGLGMGRAARLWLALFYAFAGQPVARFFQGQYLFVLGFAWIPWILDNLFRLVKEGRWRYSAGAALCLALLFFCGNAYYSLFMGISIGLFALVMLPRPASSWLKFTIDRQLFVKLAITGTLAFGLMAIQLFPLVEFWPRLSKSMEVAGDQTISQIFLDFTSKDSYRPDAYQKLPAREEFYAYIGLAPFLLLSLLPFAIWKRDRRPLVFAALLLLFSILWILLMQMPWREHFMDARILVQFRHLLRILLFGGMGLLLLAAMSADTVWQMLENSLTTLASGRVAKIRLAFANTALLVLGLFLLVSIADLYQTNRKHVQSIPEEDGIAQAIRWLRNYDPTEYTIRMEPNNIGHEQLAAAGMRFLQPWYHFGDTRKMEGMINERTVEAQPNYIIQYAGDPAPESADTKLIATVAQNSIYRLTESLPLAFSAKTDTLLTKDPQLLKSSDVTALTLFAPTPNRMEVIATGTGEETMVVLVSHYPGWDVRADGRPTLIPNISGYLAVPLLVGTHKYEFVYRPTSFYAGLLVSLSALALTLGLLAYDMQVELSDWLRRLKNLPKAVRIQLQLWEQAWTKQFPSITAIYQDGVLKPQAPLPYEDGQTITLTVSDLSVTHPPLRISFERWAWTTFDLVKSALSSIPMAVWLFAAGVLIYLFTRLWRLEEFPIYFFGDEAMQALFAESLIARNFHGADGILFPMYVNVAGGRWAPLLPMYLHALTLTLFGKTILVTRATSAVISAVGVAAAGLALKKGFQVKSWWVVVLILGAAPVWFLHSRTAFETTMTAAFYAVFLLYYLRYRLEHPKYLYAAVVFGAITFYTYSNAQATMGAAALLLFLFDLRYHLKQREYLGKAAVLALILAAPLISFQLSRPEGISEHLKTIGSYWYQAIPLLEKLWRFLKLYLYGLSPQYWFLPNGTDLSRHRMDGIAHLLTVFLPFFVIGLIVSLKRLRQPSYRTVIIAALAVPVGAATVEVGATRVLAFIIPAAMLISLGIDWLLERIPGWLHPRWATLLVFAWLAGTNISILNTALVNGPRWHTDYGLYGMQWGARQLFVQKIPYILEYKPETTILVSSIWANGAENFIQFFFTPEEQTRVRMDGIGTYLQRREALNDNTLFVMTDPEFQEAAQSPKFSDLLVEDVLLYPDGTPGFYFVRLAYSSEADEIFAAEIAARRVLVEDQVLINGQPALIRHSQIDMGLPSLIFDDDEFTLMRGLEANPFIIEIVFGSTREITGLRANFGLMNSKVKATLFPIDGDSPVSFEKGFVREAGDAWIEIDFGVQALKITKLRLEILNIEAGEYTNIHIRELQLQP